MRSHHFIIHADRLVNYTLAVIFVMPLEPFRALETVFLDSPKAFAMSIIPTLLDIGNNVSSLH